MEALNVSQKDFMVKYHKGLKRSIRHGQYFYFYSVYMALFKEHYNGSENAAKHYAFLSGQEARLIHVCHINGSIINLLYFYYGSMIVLLLDNHPMSKEKPMIGDLYSILLMKEK
jgi:hypothetical protein